MERRRFEFFEMMTGEADKYIWSLTSSESDHELRRRDVQQTETRVKDFQHGLIADDDPFFRAALSRIMLDQLACESVVEVGSLDEALETLSEKGTRIDIALFDLSMPGMSGPANLRTVREHFPDTTVAVVSASASREDMLRALDAGVHGYVHKNLGIGGLTNALRSVMAGNIYVPPSIADFNGAADRSLDVPIADLKDQDPFTPRQRDVMELLVEGKSNKEIARALSLGEGTVKIHVAALFRCLGVSSRAAAAVAGAQLLGRR